MDQSLPTVTLGRRWEAWAEVRVVRSKLHGHRGISAFSAQYVEYVPMAVPYHHYPLTRATEAQAHGFVEAVSRSEALQNPEDPRQEVFTFFPGHGTVIVEKWVLDAAPLQTMWEAMDRGLLTVDSWVPQGPMEYVSGAEGRGIVRLRGKIQDWERFDGG